MARKPKMRAPYKMVSEPTWELARAAYLGGETAAAVARRFDIGVHNLRQKIHREGWSKRALADAVAFPGPGGPPPPPREPLPAHAVPAPVAPGTEDLMATVLRRARDALTAGRGSEATALLKAARDYVVISQDVERARENIATLVPSDALISDPQVAVLSDALIQSHLGHLWVPLTPEENIARAQALWAAVPEDQRETLFPGMETYLDRLGRRIG